MNRYGSLTQFPDTLDLITISLKCFILFVPCLMLLILFRLISLYYLEDKNRDYFLRQP